ncbi:hypothetical protein OBBRIDRAFT_797204 [Obba rivulosa]|uniref:Uncharacterized protein n=1 Tax=Obba rivulosa TaxID=1052685 RepID=A0A8E2AKY2_9APHY|nr:hypothetical protein OBBRIDRAFT_797204 [Obba rivulosa]
MRPLTLHVSALNDAEYALYISSIRDIAILDDDPKAPASDAYYEDLNIGVREARAWLRGRYASLNAGIIDSILRLFSPNLAQADTLAGGQFFAVLRLVNHVQTGKQVDKSLVFVQAHPDNASQPSTPGPGTPSGYTQPSAIPLPSSSDPPAPDNNPFFQLSSTAEKFSTREPSSTPSVPSFPAQTPPTLPPKPNTNPFLHRRTSQDINRPAPLPLSVSQKRTSAPDLKVPPLPPRKPPALAQPPPPRHSSQPPPHHPLPIPALSSSISTPSNTLIKQSLQATRVAQSLKKAEQRLEKERVLEVLRSSSSTNSVRRARSISPLKGQERDRDIGGSSSASSSSAQRDRRPTLPPRPKVSPPPSTVFSAHSLEEVAHATVSSLRRPPPSPPDGPAPEPPARPTRYGTLSPSRTPPRSVSDLPPEPPPTHPDRKLSVASEGDRERDHSIPSSPNPPRVLRSRSLHHPAPPPLPPPRRPRPESAQLSPAPSSTDLALSVTSAPPHRTGGHTRTTSQGGLSRHLSMSSGRGGAREASPDAGSPFAQLQRTFSNLHQRAAPRLDAARYKAEAGFTRRGFVQHSWARQEGEERLMDDDGAGLDRDESEELDQDSALEADSSEGEESWERKLRRLKLQHDEASGSREPVPRVGMERDQLKWPVSESDGWKPL